MPAEELFNGALILVGGALLLTPGFVTDLLGLMFLIPQTRFLIKQYIKRYIQHKIDSGQINMTKFIQMRIIEGCIPKRTGKVITAFRASPSMSCKSLIISLPK